MPELGGRELAEGALKLRPGMKVMYMSGHTQDVVLKEGIEKGSAFLQKPFTPAAFAQKVRQTLDSDAPSPGQRSAIRIRAGDPPAPSPGPRAAATA